MVRNLLSNNSLTNGVKKARYGMVVLYKITSLIDQKSEYKIKLATGHIQTNFDQWSII